MANSPEILSKKLIELIESRKFGNKTEFSAAAGIDRSSLDLYIKKTVLPKIDLLDKIGTLVGERPWQLIQPEEDKSLAEKLFPSHFIQAVAQMNEEEREKFFKITNLTLEAFGYGKKNSDQNTG